MSSGIRNPPFWKVPVLMVFLTAFVLLAVFLSWSAIKSDGFARMASFGNDLILGTWLVGLAGMTSGGLLWKVRFRGVSLRALYLLFVFLFGAWLALNQAGVICEKTKKAAASRYFPSIRSSRSPPTRTTPPSIHQKVAVYP